MTCPNIGCVLVLRMPPGDGPIFVEGEATFDAVKRLTAGGGYCSIFNSPTVDGVMHNKDLIETIDRLCDGTTP